MEANECTEVLGHRWGMVLKSEGGLWVGLWKTIQNGWEIVSNSTSL